MRCVVIHLPGDRAHRQVLVVAQVPFQAATLDGPLLFEATDRLAMIDGMPLPLVAVGGAANPTLAEWDDWEDAEPLYPPADWS